MCESRFCTKLHGACLVYTDRAISALRTRGADTVRIGMKGLARGAKDLDSTGLGAQHGPCAERLRCTGLSAWSVLVARVAQRPMLLGLDTARDAWAGLERQNGL